MGRPKEARFYDREGKEIGGDRARRLFGNRRYRVVAADVIPAQGSWVRVELTTTWIGVDYHQRNGHPPKIFSTRISGGRFGGLSVRYATETEAKRGHHRALVQLLAGQPPWFIR